MVSNFRKFFNLSKDIKNQSQMDQKTLENELKNSKIREGPLYKRSKFLKQWRERWVVLTMNYIFTFTNKSCKQVTDIIDLKEIKSYKSYLRKDEQMIPAGFKIRSQDNQFYFCGKNCNQKWSWIVTLERLMDYKYVGSSTYNNIEFIKTRGFISQAEFENGKAEKTSQLEESKDKKTKSAEQTKKDVDNEVQKILKELQNQKKELKKKELQFTEKEKNLKEQEQALKKQEQEKIKELQKKISETNKSPQKVEEASSEQIDNKIVEQSPPNLDVLGMVSKVAMLKNLYEQKMIESSKQTVPSLKIISDVFKNVKKKSIQEELYTLRSRTVINLFEEFHDQNPEPSALKFILDFLVKIASDTKFGYYAPIVTEAKSHKNRKILAETFVEMITDYKDVKNYHLLAQFIEICIFQAPGFFDERQVAIIQNKLMDFFFELENEDHLQVILKNMFIVNRMQKYAKNQNAKQKLSRLIKQSTREENKNWARKLIDQF